MLTFPKGQPQKNALIAAIKADKDADRLVRGQYEPEDADADFKGCAVGCTIRALDPTAGTSDHSAYERLIGVPEQIAYLEDAMFEGLPAGLAMEWPERFTSAIPVGVDLMPAYHRFMVWLLVDPENGVARFNDDPSIADVAALHQRAALGDTPKKEEWAAAEDAARTAAWDARDAAWAAAEAAAWAAAGDARVAGEAADAAGAARAAAWTAARAAAWAAAEDAARTAARTAAGAARAAAWTAAWAAAWAAAWIAMSDRLIAELEATQ